MVLKAALFELFDDKRYPSFEYSGQGAITIDELKQSIQIELIRILSNRNGLKIIPIARGYYQVLDYGIPDTSGLSVNLNDQSALKWLGEQIQLCISSFEPRLMRINVTTTPHQISNLLIHIRAFLKTKDTNLVEHAFQFVLERQQAQSREITYG